MNIERHPLGFDFRAQFPGARLVKLLEGGAVYAAERDGKPWLIVDWGTLADLLDPVEDAAALKELVVVIEFDSAAERRAYADRELRNSPGGFDEIMEAEL